MGQQAKNPRVMIRMSSHVRDKSDPCTAGLTFKPTALKGSDANTLVPDTTGRGTYTILFIMFCVEISGKICEYEKKSE